MSPGLADRPLAPINPFTPCVDRVYRDELVEVRAVAGRRSGRRLHTVRTAHFDVTAGGPRITVDHVVMPHQVDDDLAGLLVEELFRPGWLRGKELFERIFTGVVLSLDPDPVRGWESYYRNTLRRIEECLADPGGGGGGAIADYAPVYGRAESLVVGDSVLELGCCFGFLSLRLAGRGLLTTASDVSRGTIDLLDAVWPRLGIALHTRVADAARHPGGDRSADTVLAVHLLEHLDAGEGWQVLTEAVRLGRRRVVVSVPLEEEADETWGHVRTVSLADLGAWGRQIGLPFQVFDFHGGWLVIDV